MEYSAIIKMVVGIFIYRKRLHTVEGIKKSLKAAYEACCNVGKNVSGCVYVYSYNNVSQNVHSGISSDLYIFLIRVRTADSSIRVCIAFYIA